MGINSGADVSRRDLLLLGGLVVGTVLGEQVFSHLSKDLSPIGKVGDDTAQSSLGSVNLPPLPALSIIALNRLTFGLRPGDVDAFNSLPGTTPTEKLQFFVDQQLNPSTIDDSLFEAKLASAKLAPLSKSLTQLWQDYFVNINTGNGPDYNLRLPPVTSVRAATILRAVFSKRQLQEVLTQFWHNHFSVFGWDYEYASATWAHYDRDVIRSHALGNFRQMLEAVGASPAMLFYLNNYTNQAIGPNENYARELFELHGLGAENYLGTGPANQVAKDTSGKPIGFVDEDIFAAARCFTGWRVNDAIAAGHPELTNSGEFLYFASWHDTTVKTVLGQVIPADQPALKDGRDVFDLIAAHPGTGRFIARKLCRRLIGDNPPQSVIDAAAAVFTAMKDAPDQLKQVVRTIILSDAFSSTWAQKIKTPIEVSMAVLRATNVDFAAISDAFFWTFNRMAQPFFGCRTPNGFADVKEAWLGTMSILNRWALCNSLVGGGINTNGIAWTVNLVGQMPVNIQAPAAIADFWIQRLLERPMYPLSNRDYIVDFMAQGRNPSFALTSAEIALLLPRMVELIMMSPDFQWR